jgi:glycosyltransferase involved in cell wall biosynthesis
VRKPDAQADEALVSVVIPCFNHARFLQEALESTLGQTHPRLDVVVVDDGSTDNTQAVVDAYPGVRLVPQRHQGLAAARNTGLRHCPGEYVVFLDADDRLLPEAVSSGLEELRKHPSCAFVSGQYASIDGDGARLPSHEAVPSNGSPYVAFLRRNYVSMHGTVMYRRSVLAEASGFSTSLDAAEDYDLFLRLSRRYPVCRHDRVVAEYRRHEANMTRDAVRMLGGTMTALRRQRRAALRRPETRRAYREGVAFCRTWHGEPAVGQLLRHLSANRWRIVGLESLTLLRFHPRGLAYCVGPMAAKLFAELTLPLRTGQLGRPRPRLEP